MAETLKLKIKVIDGAVLPYQRVKCHECGQRYDRLPNWKYKHGYKTYFCSYSCMRKYERRFDEKRLHTLAEKLAKRPMGMLRNYELFPGTTADSYGLTYEQEEQVYRMAEQIRQEAANG